MSPSFIIDSSITLAWFFQDERTPQTDALLERLYQESVFVPCHWSLEVVNVLTMAARKSRCPQVNADRFTEFLSHLKILVDHTIPLRHISGISNLCHLYRLTSYDAAYLELAVRTALPLATLDQDLRKAATLAGVSLLGL